MWLHVGPTYLIKSSHHLVLNRPRGLLCPRGIHSLTLIFHVLSLLHFLFILATCSAHLCLFSYVPDNVCHTTLFADPVCTLSVLELTPTIIFLIFLWVVTSFSSWGLISDQISQPYVITGSIHSLNAFLFSLIGTFLTRMMLFSLQNAFFSLRFYFSFLLSDLNP